MLADQTFHAKPIIGLGPEFFYDVLPNDLSYLRCLTLVRQDKLWEMYNFVLLALPTYGGRPIADIHTQINTLVPVAEAVVFPVPPSREEFRKYNLLQQSCRLIFSPSLVEAYRHRGTSVFDSNDPDEFLQFILFLQQPDFD